MKKIIYVLSLIVAIGTSTVSCSKSNDSDESTSYCYISSFKLGAVKRTVHTTSRLTGADSTYTTTTNASSLRMNIDHRTGIITNVDLLPMGSHLDKIPVTIVAQGSVVYAHVADTSSWKTYSSTDSLDFTQPMLFRVIATDGSGHRDYTTTIKMRENNAYGYTWQRLADINRMKDMTAARMISHGSTGVDADASPLLFTSDADGRCYYATPEYATAEQTGLPSVWTFAPCEHLDADCDVTTAVSYKGHLWMSSASGKLFVADTPNSWQEVSQSQALHLVAASATALYAAIHTNEGYTMASSIDGTTWTPMDVDGNGFNKPLAGIAYTQSNGNRRVFVVADAYNDASEGPLFAWSLLEGSGEAWLPFNDESTEFPLPRWQQPTLLTYNNWLVAMGGSDRSGQHKALDDIYISYDNGVNWKQDDYQEVPSELIGINGPITAMSIREYVWMIAGTQQWTMQYNDFGD